YGRRVVVRDGRVRLAFLAVASPRCVLAQDSPVAQKERDVGPAPPAREGGPLAALADALLPEGWYTLGVQHLDDAAHAQTVGGQLVDAAHDRRPLRDEPGLAVGSFLQPGRQDVAHELASLGTRTLTALLPGLRHAVGLLLALLIG